MIGNDWNKDGQIEIRMKAPREVEITFVRTRGPCSRRDASLRLRYHTPCVEVGTVRNESATGKQWRGRFGRSTLCLCQWNVKQSGEKQQRASSARVAEWTADYQDFPSSEDGVGAHVSDSRKPTGGRSRCEEARAQVKLKRVGRVTGLQRGEQK